ncbi:MAG: hypothetical protein HEQ10_09200 [Dolichospermum sp. DEX182a]|nr:hypothetical protein [Dolichospermum sp. DEX182a]QSV61379.1 MAG: hypothetical protein HEQ26_20600 [Dolichospermum sp. DL01]
MSVVSGQLSVVGCQWLVVSGDRNCYQSPITNYQLPITNYQLPILDASCCNWLSNRMHFN